MTDKNSPVGVCERLRRLREEAFGKRGRAAFARALGVSPSTYHYYEKGRPPPVELLARAAEVTGASAEWVLSGRGEPFPDRPGAAGDIGLSQQARDALARFAEGASAAPHAAAARAALGRLLAEIQHALPAGDSAWRPGPCTVKPTYVPIIGRTAAGLVARWEHFFAGKEDPDVLERQLRAVEGKPARQRRADMEPADPAGEAMQPRETRAVLVQLSEPTPDGCLEFVDLAALGTVEPGTFGLRVDGDSMAPRILDNDIVLARRSAAPEAGRTAVVKLKGHVGVTVKLWRPESNRVHLVPVNEAYDPTVCRREDVLWACRVLWVVRL